MNPMTPKRTRRLRARAATMHDAEDYDDYGPEPNMKLSHAFLVVLMLHVIAVGGLYAFNSMKAGKSTSGQASSKPNTATASASQKERTQESNDAPKGGGGSGQKPPTEEKAPIVAKVAEAPKSVKSSGSETAKVSQTKPEHAEKGLIASSVGALKKVAGIGATAACASKAVAQAPSTETTTNSGSAVAESPVEATSKTYTVRAGDTMTRISSSLGVAIPDLEKVNNLASNAVLQVGQVLKVPEKAIAQAATTVTTGAAKLTGAIASTVNPSQTAETNAPAASAPAQTGATTEYTVVKGDNPWKIAKKFKISQDELMKANGITDPKKIQIGQQLKIPAPAAKVSK